MHGMQSRSSFKVTAIAPKTTIKKRNPSPRQASAQDRTRLSVQRQTLRHVIRQFFSAFPQDLVLRLIEDEQVPLADLQQLMQPASGKPLRPKSRSSGT